MGLTAAGASRGQRRTPRRRNPPLHRRSRPAARGPARAGARPDAFKGRSMRRPAGRGTPTTPSWPGASLSGSPRTSGCWCRSSRTMRGTGCGGRVPTMRRSTGRWTGSGRRAVRALRRARGVEGGQGRQLPVVVSPRARPPRCAAGGRRGRAASARRCRRGGLLREDVRRGPRRAGRPRRRRPAACRYAGAPPGCRRRLLVSEDGVRVALEWRWRGETTARLLRMARSCGRPWMTTGLRACPGGRRAAVPGVHPLSRARPSEPRQPTTAMPASR